MCDEIESFDDSLRGIFMEQKNTILVLRWPILKMAKYGCSMVNWFGTFIMTKKEP